MQCAHIENKSETSTAGLWNFLLTHAADGLSCGQNSKYSDRLQVSFQILSWVGDRGYRRCLWVWSRS